MEQLSLFDNIPIVLMSLREEYFNLILEDKKHYEYRTRYLKGKSIAYIYLSKNVKKIVAKIEFGEPIIGTAEEIAKIAEKESPGSYKGMIDYFHNNIGYAIPILKFEKIQEVSLKELKEEFPNFVVPQSYYLLDKKPDLLNYLKRKEI